MVGPRPPGGPQQCLRKRSHFDIRGSNLLLIAPSPCWLLKYIFLRLDPTFPTAKTPLLTDGRASTSGRAAAVPEKTFAFRHSAVEPAPDLSFSLLSSEFYLSSTRPYLSNRKDPPPDRWQGPDLRAGRSSA